VRTGWDPIAFTVETTSALNFESRSKIRKRCGSWLYSHVSRSCRATQSSDGEATVYQWTGANDLEAARQRFIDAYSKVKGRQRGR